MNLRKIIFRLISIAFLSLSITVPLMFIYSNPGFIFINFALLIISLGIIFWGISNEI